MDTRYSNENDMNKLAGERPWLASTMLNLAYANKHGLDFRAVQVVDPVENVSIPWHKIWYLRSRISNLLKEGGSKCRYILYLDTDAWFQEFEAPIAGWLGDIGERYGISKDVALIASKEEPLLIEDDQLQDDQLQDGRTLVNSGVMILRVSADAVRLLDAVIHGGLAYDKLGRSDGNMGPDMTTDFNVFNQWPAEKGVLTKLWNESNYAENMVHWGATPEYWLKLRSETGFDTSKLAIIDMLEMNSPLGRFIQHQWGGGSTWKVRELHSALLRTDLVTPEQLLNASTDVMNHMVQWNGTEELLVRCPKELQPPAADSSSY